MTKTVLFLPGFKEGIHSRDYRKLLQMIKGKGYDVKFIDVDWKHKTLTDWRDEFMKIYEKYDTKNTILAGFSFGSMIALTAAEIKNPAELWLFSLSPHFAEDLPKFRKTWLREDGKRRVEDFSNYHFANIAPKIHCPVLLLMGEIEMRKYDRISDWRFHDAKNRLANCRAIVVPGAEHDVTDKRYIAKIEENI